MRGYYAGFVSRYIALLVDIIISVAVALTVLVSFRLTLMLLGFGDILSEEQLNNMPTWLKGLETVVRVSVAFIAGPVFLTVYRIFFWVLTGRTPGQMLMGLSVIRTNGEPVRFRAALRRGLAFWVSVLALFLGCLWVLVDDRRQAWHDKFAETFVVYNWEARYGAFFLRREAERQAQPPAPDGRR